MGAADDIRAEFAQAEGERPGTTRPGRANRFGDWRWPAALAVALLGASLFISLVLSLYDRGRDAKADQREAAQIDQLQRQLDAAQSEAEDRKAILDRLDQLLIPEEGADPLSAPQPSLLLEEIRASIAADRTGALDALANEVEAIARTLGTADEQELSTILAQLTALRAAIDAIPQGPPGPEGPQGEPAPTTTTTAPPPPPPPPEPEPEPGLTTTTTVDEDQGILDPLL